MPLRDGLTSVFALRAATPGGRLTQLAAVDESRGPLVARSPGRYRKPDTSSGQGPGKRGLAGSCTESVRFRFLSNHQGVYCMGKRKTKRQRRLKRRYRQSYQPLDDMGRLKAHCGLTPLLSWQRFKNGESHCRVTCSRCGKFLGYAPRSVGLEVLESIPVEPPRVHVGTLYTPPQDQSCPFDV